jgi:DNA (cytosine-5)-methyltransferase 1
VNYYNEYEPFAIEWLKELIKDGLIPAGDVDSRSITEVEPSDLRGYKQCHFFAGIGGWAYAARLAGWADDRPMWTGSPPCQPFSSAGEKRAGNDERHLWPVWFDIIRECRPSILFGEQVGAAISYGWLDQVQTDLESNDYACGAVVIPASAVGAPHRRERLWFVAQSIDERCQGISGKRKTGIAEFGQGNLADSNRSRQHSDDGAIYSENRNDTWGRCEAMQCKDGKVRLIPTEPEVFPVADGVPNRVGTLRGAGNAIVPQVAAEIIKAFV